ncbi:hypothetical protein ABZV14_37720 [Streptosporangium canum]
MLRAGQCVLLAPEVFDQGEDDGIVILLAPEPAGESHAGTSSRPSAPTP